jgi:polyhydroxyalkanoate synthesis regulator phasin
MAERARGSSSGGSRRTGASGGRPSTGSRRTTTQRSAAGRSDKSVQQFRDALERSVTLSRERLQEVMDDAVSRGRITRGDANELVSRMVTRGRQYTDDLLKELEHLLTTARRELETRVGPAQRQAARTAGRAARRARDVADRPLAQADRLRRRAPVSAGFPVTGYDQLTATQIKARLPDLSPAELRKVRDRERRGKARKTILAEIERRLK